MKNLRSLTWQHKKLLWNFFFSINFVFQFQLDAFMTYKSVFLSHPACVHIEQSQRLENCCTTPYMLLLYLFLVRNWKIILRSKRLIWHGTMSDLKALIRHEFISLAQFDSHDFPSETANCWTSLDSLVVAK